MSNDVSIAVVKANDSFYVEIIPGRSNINKNNTGVVLRMLQDTQNAFEIEVEALNKAETLMQEFIREFDCYPDYGIEKLDWTSYID